MSLRLLFAVFVALAVAGCDGTVTLGPDEDIQQDDPVGAGEPDPRLRDDIFPNDDDASGETDDRVRCILSKSRGPIPFPIDSNGKVAVVNTIIGSGTRDFAGDGGKALLASFDTPGIVVTDLDGNRYLTDVFNHRIRRIDGVFGVVSTIAGNGSDGDSGDGGPATEASLSQPRELIVDQFGNVFFVDQKNHRVRRVDADTGTITTVVGNGIQGEPVDGNSQGVFDGDDKPAIEAGLSRPHSLVMDRRGNLYISDTRNSRVRFVNGKTCRISTFAGTGTPGYSGDGGPAVDAQISRPQAATLDRDGNFYFVDLDNNVVRRVTHATGIIETVAGNGIDNYSGDGGPATNASLASPRGVAIDAAGNLYISTFGHRIRRVDATSGIITTLAGNGTAGFSGDGGPAALASFNGIQGLTVSPQGTLLVADWNNYRVREISFVAP